MLSWKNISLFQFQQIDEINKRDIPDIDKVLYAVCVVFGLTEYELDNTNPKKAGKLINKFTKALTGEVVPELKNKIGIYQLNHDVSTMTLGQYIEINHYLTRNPLQSGHLIMASISNELLQAHSAEGHSDRAEYFLTSPITYVLASINAVKESFTKLNSQYPVLFGVSPDVHSADAQTHPFNKKYGWMYSAEQIAAYERITLEEAYKINIRQAFHDLIYLKEKGVYEAWMANKKITNA